ncbi:hypothetical protein ABPG74_017485 [Tetrahymena malaccensis]
MGCAGSSNKQANALQSEAKKEQFTQFLSNNYGIQLENQLGFGCQSVVYKASKQGNAVAVKILKKYEQKNQEEENILQKLKNEKYVLQIIDIIDNKKQKMKALVTQLYDCNLMDIQKSNTFNFEQALELTQQLLEGLKVLNNFDVIHSDIKPDNILYCSDQLMFVFSDFGLSHELKNPNQEQTNYDLEGNNRYKSPEVTKQHKPYTLKVDVYSIGVIILEILIQKDKKILDFQNLHKKSFLEVYPNLENNENSDFVRNILQHMLNHNPSERLSPSDLLQNMKKIKTNNNKYCLKSLKLPNQNNQQQRNNETSQQEDKQVNSTKQILSGLAKEVKFTQPKKDEENYLKDIMLNFKNQNSEYEEEIEQIYQDQSISDQEVNSLQKMLGKKANKLKLKFFNCQLSNELFKKITLFLGFNHNFLEIYLDFSFTKYIKESELCSKIQQLKYQKQLQNLSLWMNQLGLTSDFIDEVSSSLAHLNNLNYFALDFKNNTSNYSCIKKLVDQVCKSNNQLKQLVLMFSGSKQNIFEDIQQIKDIFSKVENKKLDRFMFEIKNSWNKQLIQINSLEALKQQKKTLYKDFYYI